MNRVGTARTASYSARVTLSFSWQSARSHSQRNAIVLSSGATDWLTFSICSLISRKIASFFALAFASPGISYPLAGLHVRQLALLAPLLDNGEARGLLDDDFAGGQAFVAGNDKEPGRVRPHSLVLRIRERNLLEALWIAGLTQIRRLVQLIADHGLDPLVPGAKDRLVLCQPV
jgi:hypothetical protein